MPTPAAPSSGANVAGGFAATRWSVVVAAGSPERDAARRQAWEELARAYWLPLYAFVRRQGESPVQAEDLTQEFFARLIDRHDLAHLDRSKGKFRSYLLASLKHFLSNEWAKARALKRGGGTRILSLTPGEAEARYAAEPADTMTPERLFERRWALAVLDQVLLRLRDEYAVGGREPLFDALKATLTGESDAGYATIAAGLGMTEGAARVAAHRLRKRYRELLRNEIAQTVADPSLVDDELRELLNCL